MKMRLKSSVINNMFYTSLVRVLIAIEKFIKPNKYDVYSDNRHAMCPNVEINLQ
jgi:hypothetical protein